MLTSAQIRKLFLDFYAEKGHEPVSSSSLVPREDPSLLFTNAGMVQFKKIFLGQEKRSYTRATTSQKCLRVGGKHNDLENVGRTARHHTFFEMLGNFSFGDYFKEDAIIFAWDFLTNILKLPKGKLYVTVFRDDDQAEELWLQKTDVPKERILRMDEKDNFWTMGDVGPCGPCSEILIDQGEHMSCGTNCGIGKCDCDRFLEIWNLVFMQFNQAQDGTRTPLPRPSIDTGMGLERVAAVCQGVYSNFDNDLFQSIIQYTAKLSGVKYNENADIDTALRVMADHCRAMAFMVADGILPSNEGRGYVLRRLIRRAYRFGRLINLQGEYLHKVALHVVKLMKDDFPELHENSEFMARVVKDEEIRFSKTLDKGLALLEEELASDVVKSSKTISGEVAFKLYDTFGFPLDIVNDICERRGIAVDEEGYVAFMKEQKQRAKGNWKGSGEVDVASRFKSLLEDGLCSEFVGYERLQFNSRIVGLLDAQGDSVEKLAKDEAGFLISTQTPFYGASGGQTGDTGSIVAPFGQATVVDTLKPSQELTVHSIIIAEGEVLADQSVELIVEEGERFASARNHTATHLLQVSLRAVLGEHVKQAGSLVSPDRLRFDFTHIAPLSAEELQKVEADVNRAVLANTRLCVEEMTQKTALTKGATALFGEKYGDTVRVVEVPGESIELCGGTHVPATGNIGLFSITSESGVAAGVRRIEAVTGTGAYALATQQRVAMDTLGGMLKSRPDELVGRVDALQKEVRSLRKERDKLAAQATSSQGKDLMQETVVVGNSKVLCLHMGEIPVKALREVMDDVRSKLNSGVACLATELDGKVQLLVGVSKDLTGIFTASDVIKNIADVIQGSGGGRPDLAQAGGNNPQGITEAFEIVKKFVAEKLA